MRLQGRSDREASPEDEASVTRTRHRLLPRAILVGLAAGVVAVAFHVTLDQGEVLRHRLTDAARDMGLGGFIGLAALTLLCLFTAIRLVHRFAPEAGGSGIPHLKAVLHGEAPLRWWPLLIVKFLSGVIGIGAGLALGREGPTIQMGAAVGRALAPNDVRSADERLVFIAAGGAAGLAAAFNAPLSGLVFVLEELRGRVASSEFFVAALACLSADMVSRAAMGQIPVFGLPPTATPAMHLLPLFALLGVGCGMLGVLFNKALLAVTRIPLSGPSSALILLMWTIALVGTGWIEPSALGSGQHFVAMILSDGGLALALVPGYFLIRFTLTIGSYATGAAGGIFSPILVLGSLVGLGVGGLASQLFPSTGTEHLVFAVVGMAAFFTGVVRAPLTGIVLIIEMTGNYELVLPLFVACFAALLTADATRDLPIYDALLARGRAAASMRRIPQDQDPPPR